IPIYVDPIGLQEAEKTMTSPVVFGLAQVPLRTSLKLILKQLGMVYQVRGGLLTITTSDSEDLVNPDGLVVERGFEGAGFGGGMAGMGGMGFALETFQAAGSARLNQAAASDQAEEMRVQDDPASGLRLGE